MSEKEDPRIFYSCIIAGCLVIFLLVFLLIKSISAYNKYLYYKDYMLQHELATEILKARKDLKEIDARTAEIKPLLVVCLKNYSPPYSISTLQSCKNEAIGFLGYEYSYPKIKRLANTPLPADVAKIIEAK